MEANNRKKIGGWLADVESGTLCLPRFQRKSVWKPNLAVDLLKTIILNEELPIGIFLILETDSKNPTFPPRHIDGSPEKVSNCRELLLDGQQRITALWKALNDMDEDYIYYAEFCEEKYKIKDIKKYNRNNKNSHKFIENPKKPYKKNWFPITLLNPSKDTEECNKWIEELNIANDLAEKLKNLIKETRKIFSKTNGKTIPAFILPSKTERKSAIEIYQTINKNAVKLSDHYLAVAIMEEKISKSLYILEDELKNRNSKIEELESDELGELILKIGCIIQNKIPAGGNYKNLNFKNLYEGRKEIFEGIEWAVSKINDMNIWTNKQLPSAVPLRVLPALYVKIKEKKGAFKETSAINKVINRYLWHAFLTDRYSKQANERLKEDFDDLLRFVLEKNDENIIRIMKKEVARPPEKSDIKNARWPNSSSQGTLSRSILLIFCASGAETLGDGVRIREDNFLFRERHHIFPKAKSGHIKYEINCALNCMLVPAEDNKQYKDEWPGDYIQKLFDTQNSELPQLDVVHRLKTHCLNEDIARKLVSIKKCSVNKNKIVPNDIYEYFINERTNLIKSDIDKLLAKGSL